MATTIPRPPTVALPTNSQRPVLLSRMAYERLLAAEEVCFRLRDWIPYRPIRSVADVHADWDARDAVKSALESWEKLTRAAVQGGPR